MQNLKIKSQNVIRNFKFGIVILLFAFCFLNFQDVFAATIGVSPSSGSYSVGSTFTVSVRTNTQGQAVNSAEANLTYSTATLEVVRVSQGSTFYLAAPGSPASSGGTLYFGGGLPTPGYNGTAGTIGSVTFRARAAGTATVSVSSGKVLLNDGQGTNAFSGSSGAQFTITPPPVGGPEVTSTTHPNPEAWFNKNQAELSWSRPSGAYGFSFELDREEDTVPDNELDTTITTTRTYPDLEDGVWYFHIKARGQAAGSAFGPTVHYRIGVDTVAPEEFKIDLVNEGELNQLTTPSIEFAATDTGSGIDRYSIFLAGSNGSFELVEESGTSPYTFRELENGSYTIRVMAFDKAGNDREVDLPIVVAGPEKAVGFFQRDLSVPMYLLLLANLVVMLLAFLVIWLYLKHKKRKSPEDEIADIQADVDESLEALRQRISTRLKNLGVRQSLEIMQEDEQVIGELGATVGKTRKKIDKQINKIKKAVKKSKPKQ